jgi:hypothetical protein
VTLWTLLGGIRRSPKRARVGAVWIDFQHGVIKLARIAGRCIQPVEIPEVLLHLTNDARIIVIARRLVPGDYGLRLEIFKLIERGDPLQSALRVGLTKVRMNSVVDDIPANNQANGGDMQACGVSRIRPPGG